MHVYVCLYVWYSSRLSLQYFSYVLLCEKIQQSHALNLHGQFYGSHATHEFLLIPQTKHTSTTHTATCVNLDMSCTYLPFIVNIPELLSVPMKFSA